VKILKAGILFLGLLNFLPVQSMQSSDFNSDKIQEAFLQGYNHHFDEFLKLDCGAPKLINGLHCFDCSIAFKQYEFIQFMYEIGMLKQYFEIFKKIKFASCMIIFSSNMPIEQQRRGRSLHKYQYPRLSQYGFELFPILDLPNDLDQCDVQSVVENYLKNYANFSEGLKLAVLNIRREKSGCIFDKKNLMNIICDDLCCVFKAFGLSESVVQFLCEGDYWSTDELCNGLSLIADALDRKVAAINRISE